MRRKETIAKKQPTSEFTTSADLLAGAFVPVRMHLNVTVRPGHRAEDSEATGSDDSRMRRRALKALLDQHAPRLLEWTKRSTDNANLLAIDPASALLQSGVKLSDIEKLGIKAGLAAPSREVLPSGVELAAFNVKVSSERAATRRTGGPASGETAGGIRANTRSR